MRGRLIDWGCVGPRLVALAIAIGIVVLGVYLTRHSTHSAPTSTLRLIKRSELGRELLYCQDLGTRAGSDRACLAAWAENRRRFFGGDQSRSASSKDEGASQP